jgi:hypothetical protein
MTTTILALTLAVAPSPTIQPRTASYDVERVTIDRTEPCADVTALDSDGHYAGAVTLCANDAGQVEIDADFTDDLYLSVRYDNEGRPTIDSNGAPEAAERVTLVLGKIDPSVYGDDGWVPCAAAAGGTIISVIGVSFISTMVNSYVMACECLPLLVEEFEDLDCPGF